MAIPTPISFWNFDEASGNASDAVGSNTLTNTNTCTFGAGLISNCVNVSGATNKLMQIADASQTGLSFTSDFSLATWVNMNSVPVNNGNPFPLAMKFTNVGGNAGYIWIYKQEGGALNTQFQVFSSAHAQTSLDYTGGFNLGTAAWHHVAVVFVAATPSITFYLDGVQKTQTLDSSAATSVGTGATAFEIGGDPATFSWFGDTKFDMFGAWNTALSAANITSLYNAGAGQQYPFPAGSTVFPTKLLLSVGI